MEPAVDDSTLKSTETVGYRNAKHRGNAEQALNETDASLERFRANGDFEKTYSRKDTVARRLAGTKGHSGPFDFPKNHFHCHFLHALRPDHISKSGFYNHARKES
jgi:hypothetical protein